MAGVQTDREAKEYLARRIADEAKREGAPLTEVERKMLYFTESGWTLPDIMAVNEEFDRDYDQDEYEQKIGALVGKIQARDAAQSEQDQADWDDAVLKLSEGDHYLLVLIDAVPFAGVGSSRWGRLKPFFPALSNSGRRPPGDFGRLILAAIVCGALLMALAVLKAHLRDWLNH